MCSIFVQTYDCVNCDVSVGVDIYDVELGMTMIGEGYYHIPFSSLVFKDFSNGEMISIKCSESDIVSVIFDYFGESIDHIL